MAEVEQLMQSMDVADVAEVRIAFSYFTVGLSGRTVSGGNVSSLKS